MSRQHPRADAFALAASQRMRLVERAIGKKLALHAMAKVLNATHFVSRRGGRWGDQTVKNVYTRVESMDAQRRSAAQKHPLYVAVIEGTHRYECDCDKPAAEAKPAAVASPPQKLGFLASLFWRKR